MRNRRPVLVSPQRPPRGYCGDNGFIHYGKCGEFASNQREDQELSMLWLHLL
jgi:hypothetical protein